MSKYQPLSARLASHPEDEWRASFSELEGVLGFSLPKGARTSSSWWSNDEGRSHSRAWTRSGWMVSEVDRTLGSVVFRRNVAAADIEAAGGVAAQASQACSEVQPEAMRKASEGAARAASARRAAPFVAAGVAGVAVIGGLVALFVRGMGRLRSTSRA